MSVAALEDDSNILCIGIAQVSERLGDEILAHRSLGQWFESTVS